jgi:hypothetical protein
MESSTPKALFQHFDNCSLVLSNFHFFPASSRTPARILQLQGHFLPPPLGSLNSSSYGGLYMYCFFGNLFLVPEVSTSRPAAAQGRWPGAGGWISLYYGCAFQR